MKKSELRQIIKEEIRRLNEINYAKKYPINAMDKWSRQSFVIALDDLNSSLYKGNQPSVWNKYKDKTISGKLTLLALVNKIGKKVGMSDAIDIVKSILKGE